MCALWAASPAAGVPLTEVFPLPAANSRPVGIAVAPDENIWFTDPGIDAVGRITPAGALTLLALPSPSGPAGIVSDRDGNIWFTENDRGAIGRFSAAPPHVLEQFFLPTPGAQPFAIAIAPDGDIWFTELGANQIGRLAAGGTITEFPIPTELAVPAGIAVTSDGAVWFTEFNRNGIGRLDPDGSFTETPLRNPGSGPFGIVADASDTVFFTQLNGNRIGRIAPDGFYAEFQIPTVASQPAGITIGRGGNPWFTQINADQVAVLIGDLVFEFAVPRGSFEAGSLFGGGIGAGPGDQLTFAASAAGAIDHMQTCATNAECSTGNCEFLLCARFNTPTPRTPTPTPGFGPEICATDASCQPGFFCNVAEGRLCCEMKECPAGLTCRFPGREGFCTNLPTGTPSPTRTPQASASPSSTSTVTLAATATPTAHDPPALTPAPTSSPPSAKSSSGGGCRIVQPRRSQRAWLLLLPLALLGILRRRTRNGPFRCGDS